MIVQLLDKMTNPYDTNLSSYCFKISDIAKFVSQELAKHKGASLSVRSDEYTLEELKNEAPFVEISHVNEQERRRYHYDRAVKYIDLFDQQFIGKGQLEQLEYLREGAKSGTSIDKCKFLLTESYKCVLVLNIDFYALKNFLRLEKSAHFRIRELAYLIFQTLPPEDRDLLCRDIPSLLETITSKQAS